MAIRLIEIYKEEAPRFVRQLGEAIANQDAVSIRQNAHWLKSASAHIGAKSMSESCQVMQIYGMENNLSRADVLFREIDRTNTNLIHWLNEVSDVSTAATTHAPPPQGYSPSENPVDGASSENSEVALRSDYVSPPSFSDKTILIIDDSSVSCEIVKNFLGDLACELVFAHNGQAAIDLCNANTFDLILTDCEMFGMDGYQFTQKFREIESLENATRTPIVALTAHALRGDRARCIAAGMDDYLSKPYTIEELHDKVEEWLAKPESSSHDVPPETLLLASA